MRLVQLALLTAILLAQLSCMNRHASRRGGWLTGTCVGACDYYAHCKERSGHGIALEVQDACTTECRDVFSSPESLLAFESLVCEDAVAFVEGNGGREPGEPPRM